LLVRYTYSIDAQPQNGTFLLVLGPFDSTDISTGVTKCELPNMRTVFTLFLSATLLGRWLAAASAPVPNVQVTLRGKKYDVTDVRTVQDLQDRIEEVSGILAPQQGRVLFDGKRLESTDVLADVGVADGAQLNIVPSSKAAGKVKKTATTTESKTDSAAMMEDYLRQAGLDGDKLDELMKGMSGSDGKVPSMEESLGMMNEMMNSPIFQEYMSDPAKLEESRQMILNNPMLKSMMAGMPGMEDILNDPEAWREAMQAAASLYKNMDKNQLTQAMMGMGGMGGGMPDFGGNMFDGTLDNSAAAAALDELDEDD
jgi:hypothetical protein